MEFRQYRVTGPVAFMGHDPDEVFSDELPDDMEARAIARGAIVRYQGRTPAQARAAQKQPTATEGKDSESGVKTGRSKSKKKDGE